MAHITLRSSLPSRVRLILPMLSFAVASLAMRPVAARAQARYTFESDPRYEISIFIGARMGGRINLNTPNVDYLHIDNSLNWGFNVGKRIVPNFFAEFMWNRQTTTLKAHDVPDNRLTTLTTHAQLDMYQGNLLFEIPTSSPIRPFVVGGLGFTHFDSHGILSYSNRFSYNLGGGVKYLFTSQVAARAELRWSPSRTSTASTTFCDPFIGCFTTPISNHAEQWQANIGLEFRF